MGGAPTYHPTDHRRPRDPRGPASSTNVQGPLRLPLGGGHDGGRGDGHQASETVDSCRDDVTEQLAVAVDLGGTKILSAVIDAHGEVLARMAVPTAAHEGPDAVLVRIDELIAAH